MAVYLDCAATTPLDPRVREAVLRYLDDEFGNAGSGTHDYGRRARRAVEQARQQVAAVVHASRGDVIFTSGATESNNLAILGLAHAAAPREGSAALEGSIASGRHIVTTAIEHHAVLEPIRELERRGFSVTVVPPAGAGGAVDAEGVCAAIRPDTLLVSVMHVNNETGVMQPIAAIADRLAQRASPCVFHVDAAQGFGKELEALRHPRIDLISVSGHKIGAPKGIGALIARRAPDAHAQAQGPTAAASAHHASSSPARGETRAPLAPLMFGGGQERGLRPGTQAVHLIVGLGLASELAVKEWSSRQARCLAFREQLVAGLAPLAPIVNGDPARTVPNILNVTLPGLDAEAVMEAWADLVAISNGAACTSQSYTCSHVLGAMRLDARRVEGALRFSWTHDSALPDLPRMVAAIASLRASNADPAARVQEDVPVGR